MTGISYYFLYIVSPGQLLEGAFFFLVAIILILCFVIVYMRRRVKRSVRKKKLRRQFADLISYLAISDSEEECREIVEQPIHQQKIVAWLKDPFARRLLIRELVRTSNSMSGQAKQNMAWFYNLLELDKDTLAALKSKHWHIKARAVQQLSELQQAKYLLKIYKLTDDKHELVRNEARVAVVKMSGFEGLRFLEIISYPITEWEQICLLEELPQQVNVNYQAMGRWLRSTNDSVVEFTLRLVARYRAHELHDEVVNCLRSPEKDVRAKAIQALQEIAQANTTDILIANFEGNDLSEQLAIIKTVQEIGSDRHVPFLANCLNHDHDELKAAAARAIRQLHGTGITFIKQQVNIYSHPWIILIPQLQNETIP